MFDATRYSAKRCLATAEFGLTTKRRAFRPLGDSPVQIVACRVCGHMWKDRLPATSDDDERFALLRVAADAADTSQVSSPPQPPMAKRVTMVRSATSSFG